MLGYLYDLKPVAVRMFFGPFINPLKGGRTHPQRNTYISVFTLGKIVAK